MANTIPHSASQHPARRAADQAVIIFRCDDYGVSDGLTAQIERQLVALFAKHGLVLVFGVVPTGLKSRPDQLDFLRPHVQSGVVEAALHGWDHQPQTALLAAHGAKSEFKNRPYSEQLARIQEGKRLLEQWFGWPVRTFIPPWDSYDAATLQACAQVGLEVLSATVCFPPAGPPHSRLALLPSSVRLPALEALVQASEQAARPGNVAVVEFHAYEFFESGHPKAWFSLEQFERLLVRVACCPNLVSMGLGNAAQEFGPALTTRRYLLAQEVYRSAAALYQNVWRTRLGNRLRLFARLDSLGYETEAFYARQAAKQKLLHYFPHMVGGLSLLAGALLINVF